MFGSIFFLSQYMQNVLHNTPLQAGLKLLVWTGASMVVAPLGGRLLRALRQPPVHGRRPDACRRCALGWLALMTSTHLPYSHMIVPFIMAGAGMALVFAPSANAVLSSVRTEQAGQASGANNAIREVGGVLGVAVLASVFTGAGGYSSPQAFVDGLIPAMWVGVAVLAAGALVVLLLPFRTPRAAARSPRRGHASGARRGAARARRRREGALARAEAWRGARWERHARARGVAWRDVAGEPRRAGGSRPPSGARS